MKRFLQPVLMLLLLASVASGDTDPWAAWPYRLHLRVATPELADFSHMATVRFTFGSLAASNLADIRILDEKAREQPWQLRSMSPSGELTLVFQTVKGTRDYTLIFGNPAAAKPVYGVTWPIGRALIDDRLPSRVHTHGIWEWVTAPVVSGAFSHTSPLADRVGFHGTSEMGELSIYDGTVIQQYVMLDKANPPQQILMRFAMASRPNEGDWEHKQYLVVSWGKSSVRSLAREDTLLRMGDLPQPGEWERLDIKLPELLRRANIYSRDGFGMLYLYGIGFATDKGRAWWDVTSMGDVPGEAEVLGLERAPTDKPGTPNAMDRVGGPPTFVYTRLRAFKLAGTERVLNQVAFYPSVSEKTKCRWDFGDGTTSQEQRPVHVFEGVQSAKVSLVMTEPGGQTDAVSADLAGLKDAAREFRFAVELVSCPFIVRSDEKALFNLRVEGNLDRSMDIDMHAILLDANDVEIGRRSSVVTVLPGLKHPTFTSFSPEVSAERLSRIRFEARLAGVLLAKSVVTLQSSRSALSNVQLVGDRYVDRFGTPVVVRCELSDLPGEPKGRARTGLPWHVLLIGGIPTPDESGLEQHLEKAIASASSRHQDVSVKRIGVEPEPAWSMPFRQAIALSQDEIPPSTEVVIVGSATEMMLGGIPARTAADALGVVVDQVRRKSDAEVFLLTPVVYSSLEDLARQYAVALRMLGIEKNVPVIDVYSRSVRLVDREPELLKTAKVTGGVLVPQLDPRILREITEAVVDGLTTSPDIAPSP